MEPQPDVSYLHPRIRAIEIPCPCPNLSPRFASLLATGGLTVIYLIWTGVMWTSYFALDKLKAFVNPASVEFVEMKSMSTLAVLSAWFFSTLALLSFVAFVTTIFPHQELAKHLSRFLWLGWIATWTLGVYGLAAHLSADSWMQAGWQPCELYRQRLQISLFVSLFVTLALGFWFALVFSAFVHTLHPHIFYTGDVDSELDEYDHACLLEAELRNSDHPLAGEAAEWVQAEHA
ncbi:uncharacterized protein JCM15063_005672 [Sporobolomyces koalae]|uniref:uncharacterized protein n=1 Tax=Sporobolomyces koalae TaxID=500713 RepID=UPI0031715577